jgi:hypothetical protein
MIKHLVSIKHLPHKDLNYNEKAMTLPKVWGIDAP